MISDNDLLKPDNGQPAIAIHIIDAAGYEEWLKGQSERVRTALHARRYTPKGYEYAILPGDQADNWSVVTCVANVKELSSWCLAKLAEVLPEGTYRVANGQPGPAVHGWMTAQYRFRRYRKDENPVGPRTLLTGEVAQIESAIAMARAVTLVRDMVNTPTADMGPAELEKIARDIALEHDAQFLVTKGDELETGYPMIHAVGRAADRANAPRLIEIEWGHEMHPRIAIVGKGVCFDSGGLDIKPSSAMRLMKKDMGGAAHALALAQLIMAARLPVRMHVLIPAVENAVSGNAFRPGDILKSRAGITVEIGNTDAEGRLILADAMARATENRPELMLDFATLTGAARTALGPDLPALFANEDGLADQIARAGKESDDQVWRLPLWKGYTELLKSDVADVSNSGDSPFAGAITAALFLEKFVPLNCAWAHLDTFAWRPTAKPGRPKGGEALGLRAAYHMIQRRFGRSD